MKRLLSVGKDPKTVKGQKFGYLTGILYLAPAKSSGFNVCENATKGCSAACLYTAGRGATSSVQVGRLNKTVAFFSNTQKFVDNLMWDIRSLIKKAAKINLIPVV